VVTDDDGLRARTEERMARLSIPKGTHSPEADEWMRQEARRIRAADCADVFPDIGDYGPPEGHSATELATHDYDGTYGASLGSLAVRTCRRCAAVVDAAGTERHDAWHRMIEGALPW
jgi:hypothetical protein